MLINVCTVCRCVVGPQIRSIYAIVCKAWKNVNVCTVVRFAVRPGCSVYAIACGTQRCFNIYKFGRCVVWPQIRSIYAIVCKAQRNVCNCRDKRCVVGPQIRCIYAIVCKAWWNVNVCTVGRCYAVVCKA